ncbi:MAG: Gfo/Idh/MocA family oxidoreductase [Prolixibacteraceae bacterium]|nr:Gfo/Idh/MocA family oxidoreductase [Prolixibacteraceae bacterium]
MDRRNFLKISGTASSAICLGLAACQWKEKFRLENIPDEEKIKIGIIGVGGRGLSILEALKNVPEIKVIAICDLFDFRLKNADDFLTHKVRKFKDFNNMLDMKELQAVIIATPLSEHFRMVMAALDRNLHVLCEKALAYSIDQCMAIKQKASCVNKIFQISYQYQLNPMFNAIKQIIDKGYCGRIMRVEGTWDRNGSWRRKLPDPAIVPEVSPAQLERIINWRLYKEYSGGLIAELGSHQFNMIDNILGAHPLKAVGTGGIDYWKDGRETFDNVHVLFDYPNGVKVGFHSGTSNKYEGFQMKFYGDKATIVTQAMDKAFIYPEDQSMDNTDWQKEVDSVTGASIKIIDKDKKRTIKPVEDNNIIFPTDNFYYNTTWLLYKNFAAAINGKKQLLLGLNEGYQSGISVHIANMAIHNNETTFWKPEYDSI